MHAILGPLILVAAAGALARLARGRPTQPIGAAAESPYRVGPWPGLTGRGAAALVVCSGMLVGCELVLGSPGRALPDLVVLAVIDLIPPLLGTCLVRAPGCASAVCGVYLLGRSLASMINPGLDLPPLLLPPAVACDLAIWLRAEDFRRPTRGAWARRKRPLRRVTGLRAAAGGAIFAGVLAAVEPPYALLLGAEPASWTTADRVLAAALAVLAGAAAGAAIEGITNRPRAASSPA